MTKNIFSILLFSLLILGIGCSSSKSPSKTEKSESTEMTENTEKENPTPASGGAAYTTTVVKDGIASPRKEMTGQVGEAKAQVTVNYGSPSAKGRNIWGGLVPYGEVWRTGANEATWIKLSSDVMVEGEKLPAGTYSLFTIPNQDSWIIIFNKTAEQWGAYKYKEADDVLRVKVATKETESMSETMDFALEGDNLVILWGNLAVPIKMAN